MKQIVIGLVMCILTTIVGAQDLTIVSTKFENSVYKSQVKFGRTIDYTTESVFEMKNENGDLFFGNLPYDSYEPLIKGSTKELYFQTSGPVLSSTTKINKLGTTPTLVAYERFKCSFETAFIDDAGYYAFSYKSVEGAVKVGDQLMVLDQDGKSAKVTINGIELKPNEGSSVRLNAIDERFKIDNGFSLCFYFSSSASTGPGGKFTLSAGTESTSPQTTDAVFKGEREVMKKDIVLTDGKIKITLNALVKYAPKQADNPVFKIDETIDYYILDVTVENLTDQTLDAGAYLIHLNLYDAAGVNSDDHGRLFKNVNSEAKSDVDVIDQQVLGGTSAIRYAAVVAMYSEQDPLFNTEQCDLAFGMLAPKQKVTCTAAKAIGVPKTYMPTEIGFWLENIKKTVKVKL